MDFDGRLLRAAGGLGRRARLLAAASWLPNVPLALGLAAGLLLATTPPHRCRPDPALLPPALRNASGQELLDVSAPRGSACLLYRYPPPGGALGPPPPPNGTGPCTRGWQYALPEAGLRSTVVTQWDLVCSKQWLVPLEQITYLLGWFLGYVGFGSACDRFGRRTIFLTSLMLSILLGVVVALAVNYVMLVLTRMLFGMMLAGTFVSLYVARLELCDPQHRLVVTMSAEFFWVAGELLLPALAMACKEWRLLQGTITLGLALLAVCWWCPSLFPESARWLLATQQLEKGKGALRDLAEGNGVRLEEDFYTQEHLFAQREDLSDGPQYHGIFQVLNTRVVWKNSLILGFTALIGSGIRYCFTRNLTPFTPQFYFPYFLLAVSEALAALFLCLTVDRFGRRAVLLLSTILAGVSSLLLLALTQYLMAWLVLALSVLGILASQAVTALSVLFASEVLPTVVRGSGLGLILAAWVVGQAAAPLLDLRQSRGFFLHHVVFASFAILSVLSIMLLPETSNRSLPESLQDGESQRRPPLFRRSARRRHRDHLPLLSTRPGASPYDPDSYARLVTATKKMLDSRHGLDAQEARQPLLEPTQDGSAQEEM